MLLAAAPALPAWLVVPMAVVALGVLGWYARIIRDADVPPARRRVRTAGVVVLMLLVPLSAYLFGFATITQPRAFVMVWASVVALLGLSVALACVDASVSMRVYAGQRRALRVEAERLRAVAIARRARATPPQAGAPSLARDDEPAP